MEKNINVDKSIGLTAIVRKKRIVKNNSTRT